MIYVGILLATSTPFLLLFGESVSRRIRVRRTAEMRRAWITDHIREDKEGL